MMWNGSLRRRVRALVALAALVSAAACSDSLTGPQNTIDRATVDLVMVNARHASSHLVPALDDKTSRIRLGNDIGRLQVALAGGNGPGVRGILSELQTSLMGYLAAPEPTSDWPDLNAITLELHAISNKVGGSFNLSAFTPK